MLGEPVDTERPAGEPRRSLAQDDPGTPEPVSIASEAPNQFDDEPSLSTSRKEVTSSELKMGAYHRESIGLGLSLGRSREQKGGDKDRQGQAQSRAAAPPPD